MANNDHYYNWYGLYDKLSEETNPSAKELKLLFSSKAPIDEINLRGLRLKLKAATHEPTAIEKTMSPYQLYVSDNPLWTNGLSAQNIAGIMEKNDRN